jgi:hypothetical protein
LILPSAQADELRKQLIAQSEGSPKEMRDHAFLDLTGAGESGALSGLFPDDLEKLEQFNRDLRRLKGMEAEIERDLKYNEKRMQDQIDAIDENARREFIGRSDSENVLGKAYNLVADTINGIASLNDESVAKSEKADSQILKDYAKKIASGKNQLDNVQDAQAKKIEQMQQLKNKMFSGGTK